MSAKIYYAAFNEDGSLYIVLDAGNDNDAIRWMETWAPYGRYALYRARMLPSTYEYISDMVGKRPKDAARECKMLSMSLEFVRKLER